MGVFDQGTITILANQDPGTDNSLPAPRWLDYRAIASDTALRNTRGIDCKVVHGRREQHIYGLMNEWVDNNLTSLIGADEVRHVIGNFTETVDQIYTLTVNGGWMENQNGAVNRHYAEDVTDMFDKDHQVSGGDTFFSVVPTSNVFVYGEQISIVMFFQLQVAIFLAVTATGGIDLEAKSLHAEYHWGHGDAAFMRLYHSDAKVDINGVAIPVETQAAVRVSANAGIDVDTAFPPV